MERETQPPACGRYCCSSFHQYQDRRTLRPSDLTNQILPLFAIDRYKNELEYSVLEPALRLATKLLTSGGAARYICTMTDGYTCIVNDKGEQRIADFEDLDQMRDSEGRAVFPTTARYPKANTLQRPDRVKRRAIQILSDLADMVDIEFANLPEDVRGYSKAIEGPLTSHLAPRWPRGVRSRVSIAATMYFDLVRLARGKRLGCLSNRERELLLLAQFSYATTLVHEVGHALICAVQGSIHRGEPFHGDCELAEAGYALEAAIFGDLLDGNVSLTTRQYAESSGLCSRAKERLRQGKYVKNALTLTQWPSGIYQHSYQIGHAIIGCRRQLLPYDEVARVPISFVSDLFSAGYWATEDRKCTLAPISVPKVGTWTIGVEAETGDPFVCDLGQDIIDSTIEGRLQAIIGKGGAKSLARSSQKSSGQSTAAATKRRLAKRRKPGMLKLVEVLGEEVRKTAIAYRPVDPVVSVLDPMVKLRVE